MTHSLAESDVPTVTGAGSESSVRRVYGRVKEAIRDTERNARSFAQSHPMLGIGCRVMTIAHAGDSAYSLYSGSKLSLMPLLNRTDNPWINGAVNVGTFTWGMYSNMIDMSEREQRPLNDTESGLEDEELQKEE